VYRKREETTSPNEQFRAMSGATRPELGISLQVCISSKLQ